MKKIIPILVASVCITAIHTVKADEKSGEKPVKHLKLSDIVTEDQATAVMETTSKKLKAKKKLDAAEMHEIHIITYSLEKAVAYFVENSKGDKRAIARRMAEVVEEMHLNSENNRKEKTRKALDHYFKLEGAFSKKVAKLQ